MNPVSAGHVAFYAILVIGIAFYVTVHEVLYGTHTDNW